MMKVVDSPVSGAARGLALILAWVCMLAHADTKLLRERTPEQRPTLLVIGTAHFANPGRDLINPRVDDVLAAGRQAQIADVVRRLASFRPTHIALEWEHTDQRTLDAHYRDFRAGRYTLSANEQDQLGLRLAAILALPHVYAIDWNRSPSGDAKDYDWLEYGKAHHQEALVAAIVDPARTLGLVPLDGQTIDEWLLALNRPQVLAGSHRNYFDLASVGDIERQPGANWVGYWYGRNLRIFANLVRLTDDPQARVLVIYGQGHAFLLRQFAAESGAFRVLDAEQVLGQK